MTALAVVVVALVAAFGANAFTASNTIADHSAGAGAAAVSGYSVSNPNYTWSADGTTVTAVSFDLDKAASDVKAALSAAAPVHADWVDCGASGAATPWLVTCTFTTPVATASAEKLSVAAVSSGTVTIAP